MDVYENFKKYFGRNYCLLRLAKEIKTSFIESNVEDMPKGVLCYLFGQLRNIYESVNILCRRGFPQQANILLRSLQEGYIRIHYILHKKEAVVEKVKEWIEFDAIERKKMLYSIEGSEKLNSRIKEKWLAQKDDILKLCKETKERGRLWPQKPVEHLCNEAGLHGGEYIIYRDLSMKGHLSPWGTRGQVKLKEQTLYYRFGPTKEKEEIISALDLAHLCFLLILMRLSSYFGIESDQKQKLNWHIKLRNKNLRNEAE